MTHQTQAGSNNGDRLELEPGGHPFDLSATAWLINQGVFYLNTSGNEGEAAYKHVVELLAEKEDTVETLIELSRSVPVADVSLRWCLLYIMGDTGNVEAAKYLAELSVEQLQEYEENEGCEGPLDGEILVRTMAIVALQQIATRYPESSDYVLEVVDQHPTRPLLIEAVKAASALGYKEKAAELLLEEDRWMLDINQARVEEIYVEPERGDNAAYGYTPPKTASLSTSPNTNYDPKQED